jgi:hypothetical protein
MPKGRPMNPCRNKWQQKWIGLDVVHPSLQGLADAAEKFCARWFENSPFKTLLVISGETGSGKTRTARKIYDFCRRAGSLAFESGKWGTAKFPDAAFISWPEACNQFNDKNLSLLDDANNSDLVVLDDVGAENDPWKICSDKLCQILSRREKRFTVITTNVPPANWSTAFDIRINDRLLRNSVVVDLTGVSSYALRP